MLENIAGCPEDDLEKTYGTRSITHSEAHALFSFINMDRATAEHQITSLLSTYGSHESLNAMLLGDKSACSAPQTAIADFLHELSHYEEVLRILDLTRFVPFKAQPNFEAELHSEKTRNPHWALASHLLFRRIYHKASEASNVCITRPYLPPCIAFDLYKFGELNLSAPLEIPDRISNTRLLKQYQGQEPVTVSSYMAGLSFNLGRLEAQAREDETASKEHPRPRTNAVEIATYHIAVNIGIADCIAYLRNLWSDGWLHSTRFYSVLYVNLLLYAAHANNATFLGGRRNYVNNVLFFEQSSLASAALLFEVASHLFERFRADIAAARNAGNLNGWLHALHKSRLSLHAFLYLNNGIDRSALDARHSKDLLLMWRYCMELDADIFGVMHDVFRFPIMKLRSAFERASDIGSGKRSMKFFVRGRVTLPNAIYEKLEPQIISGYAESKSRCELDQRLASALISEATPQLVDVYSSVYPVTPEQIARFHDAEYRRRLKAGLIHEPVSDDVSTMAACLSGAHMVHYLTPPADRPGGFEFSFGEGLSVNCHLDGRCNIELMIVTFKDTEERDGHVRENPPATPSDGDRRADMVASHTGKQLQLLALGKDVLRCLDWKLDIDTIAFERLRVDHRSSNLILDVVCETGRPICLQLVPRSFLENPDARLPQPDEGFAQGIASTLIKPRLAEMRVGLFRGVDLNSLPVDAVFLMRGGKNHVLRTGSENDTA